MSRVGKEKNERRKEDEFEEVSNSQIIRGPKQSL